MTVVLLILKIIGIILLVILGLLLVLLLNLLLNPVRYRVFFQYQEELILRVKASWLFHILTVLGTQTDEGFVVTLKIFGIPKTLYGGQDAEEEMEAGIEAEVEKDTATEDDHKEESTEPEKDALQKEEKNESEKNALKKEQPQEEPGKSSDKKQKQNNPDRKTDTNRKEQEEIWQEEPAEEKQNGKKQSIFCRIKEKLTNIRELIEKEENKASMRGILKEVQYILRHYGPRKTKGALEFSLGDPALTGQVLGLISLVPAIYRYDFQVYPDFVEEKLYVRGEITLRGRVRMVHLARSGFHLFRDKNIRKMIKSIRK